MDDQAPRRIDGWRGLSDWLATLSIVVGPEALYARTRRHYLPFQGGRSPGARVHFTRRDLNAWVRHFVHVEHDIWFQQRARNCRNGNRVVLVTRGRYTCRLTLSAHERPPGSTWGAYAVLRRQDSGALRIAREADGDAALVRRKEELENWIHRLVDPRCHLVSFGSCRPAVLVDFEDLFADGNGGVSLVGAVEVRRRRLQWVRIRASRLGLEGARATPVALLSTSGRLARVRRTLQRVAPRAIWMVWPGLRLLDSDSWDELDVCSPVIRDGSASGP